MHGEQKKAADKFMKCRNHDILELPTGQGLVIKRSPVVRPGAKVVGPAAALDKGSHFPQTTYREAMGWRRLFPRGPMTNPIEVLRRLVRNVDVVARHMTTLSAQARNVDVVAQHMTAVSALLQDVAALQRTKPGSGAVIDGAEIAPVQGAPDGSADADRAPPPIDVGPLAEIPYPVVDLSLVGNPVRLIVTAPEFEQADRFFCATPALSRSIVSARSQALIYALVRNLQPDHVFEIGTYRAGTSEAICRALLANGKGTLHTVDPLSADVIVGILRHWPAELRQHIRFYALDSMAFFGKMAQARDTRPLLVFVDGNHDYQYAAFDIACAAEAVGPGGFVVVDNVAQAGPYLAATDFLRARPGWSECAAAEYRYDPAKPFDRERSGIPGTEFMVLRAPPGPRIGERPVGFPEVVLIGRSVNGIEIEPGRGVGKGQLHAQCVVRGFSSKQNPVEVCASASIAIGPEQGGSRLKLAIPTDLDASAFEHIRVEAWLSWAGEMPLPLLAPPKVY